MRLSSSRWFIWTIGGALVLGFPIWILINYILYVASWAPLRNSTTFMAGTFFILSTIISYGGSAYLCDRLGKKRDYRPSMQSLSWFNIDLNNKQAKINMIPF